MVKCPSTECLYLLTAFLFFSAFAYCITDNFFSFENQTADKKNLKFNHPTKALLNDKDYDYFYISDNGSSVNLHYVKQTFENDTGNWSIPHFEILDKVDLNGSYAEILNGSLVSKNGSSINTEPFQNQNNSVTNYNLSLSESNAIDIKNFSLITDNCHKNNFSESLFCKKETKRRISCYLNFSETVPDPRHYLESGYRSVTSKKDIPQYSVKNASCNILVTVDRSYYALHNHHNESVISEIHLIFDQINHILSNTDFDNNGRQDDVSVRIKNIILKEAVNNSGDYNSSTDITRLIEDFREIPQNSCASLLFVAVPTAPDYVSTAYMGGICKSNQNEPDPARNVALVNLVDSYGCKRSLFTATRIVATVVGQIMGSAHGDCNPVPPLLLEKYQSSYFSDCAIQNIYNLVTTQGSCLEVPETENEFLKPHLKSKNINPEILNSACGNGRINPGEECDCGTKEQCKRLRSCCIPPGKKGECHYDRSKGYECDWLEDCCTRNCKIVPKIWQLFCGIGDDDCAPEGSYCDGKSSHCPVPKLAVTLLNGKMCGPGRLKQLGSATCQYGRCNSTVCQDAGLEDCMCASSTKQQCRVCCRQVGSQQKRTKEENARICIPAEFFGLKPTKEKFFYRHPGTLCSEVRWGHCNGHGNCVHLSMVQSSAISLAACQHINHFAIGVLCYFICVSFYFLFLLKLI